MAASPEAIFDWEEVAKYNDLSSVVNHLPPDKVIEVVGVENAIRVIGPEQIMATLLKSMTAEQIQELVRAQQEKKAKP